MKLTAEQEERVEELLGRMTLEEKLGQMNQESPSIVGGFDVPFPELIDNDITAEVELGTYVLTDKMHDKWFERHWFLGGNKESAYVDGFFPTGKVVRTSHLLENVGGKRTMTAAGPTRSFGPPAEGTILTEELPQVNTRHEDYFENYKRAYRGEEEFLVKIPETARVLQLMEAVRESSRTGRSIDFE